MVSQTSTFKKKLKKKVIIAHGYWGRGGAEIATMYLINAIKDKYEVHLVTRGGWDLEELNTAARTSISPSEVILVKLPFAYILKQTVAGNIWHAIFLKYCRYIAPNYDIRITASRIIGWGRPALHFLSDVVWNPELEKSYATELKKPHGFKKILFLIGKNIGGKSFYELHKDDVFIANSRWTAQLSAPYTTSIPIVINPPINQEFELIPWELRLNQFVSFGRISPEKRIEDSISILEKVRERNFDVKLTIFGQFSDNDYSKRINDLIKDKDWVDAPGAIYGDKVKTTLPQYRYAISSCTREAFGISTGEIIMAGIIPFVPFEGAQKELVQNENLIFDNVEEAVSKVVGLLASEKLQLRVQQELLLSQSDMSFVSFKHNILRLLES
ncbi:glycosyltransferase [uncultured Gelidibacter sp.]|uniref:glycosyltransferase n=1 Tax=uncultured Gelidibacter sp. TaxID=259318 RepID=UPI00262AFF1A|nr:glycosyltransferase [uncultured Gelidibacter sp.]